MLLLHTKRDFWAMAVVPPDVVFYHGDNDRRNVHQVRSIAHMKSAEGAT